MWKSLFILGSLISVSLQQSCSRQENSDIDLPDLAAHPWTPESSCCSICSQNPQCKAFAWNNHEGGTCWLKSGTGPVVWKEGVSVGILNGGPGDPALVTFTEFTNGVVNSNGCPAPTQAQYDAFIAGLPKSLITTKQEAAMALTHYVHESDCLRAKREYRCQHDFCPGEYLTPGCDVSSDRYYGRGYIQLTWCENYKAASLDLFGDTRLVNDPDSVAREETLAWNTAFHYWKARVHNQWGVQDGMFGASTRAINGFLECDGEYQHVARKRFEMYGRVRQAFGLAGPGDERGCYN